MSQCETGGASIRSPLPPRAHLWHRARGGRGRCSRGVGNANKNARGKKGGRGRHYTLLGVPVTIIMAVGLISAPTLTLIRPSEHRTRARVTSVSSLPF